MAIQHGTYAVPRADLGEALHEMDASAEGFIATEVFPIRDVPRKAATIGVVTRENTKRADAKHSNGGAFNRVNLTTEDKAYACEDFGLEGVLSDDDRANYASDYDAELETSQIVQRAVLVEQEVRVKTAVFNTTTFTGAALFTDNSAAPWDAAASDAIGQIQAAKDYVRINSGMPANAIIMGKASLNNLLANTAILARFPGALAITQEMLQTNMAAIFGLEKLIVGTKTYDSAIEGQVFVGADIWPDDYAMVCRISEGPLSSGGLGRTLLWTPLSPDIVNVETYREEQTKSDIIRVEQYCDELLCDAYFGHLMQVDA